MSGLPYWTTDIGGFFRPDDQYTSDAYHELLIRWFEYGTFCPLFRVHGYKSNAELWNYGSQVERVLTQYDALRYHLLPYIYSAAWGVTKNGETLMRALPLEFSSDPKAREVQDQFMFGPALLINPVTKEGVSQRTLYLPAGTSWVDFWTGKTLSGGQIITADAPLDRIPMYAKSGSILAFGPSVESASAKSDPVELRIYSGADGDFALYEDEGDNYDYERGANSVIPIHWDDKTQTLTIGDRRGTFPGMLEHRTFRVVRVTAAHGVGICFDACPILVKAGKARVDGCRHAVNTCGRRLIRTMLPAQHEPKGPLLGALESYLPVFQLCAHRNLRTPIVTICALSLSKLGHYGILTIGRSPCPRSSEVQLSGQAMTATR
jgi:alpha-D-xyloside xylohydrolase